MAEQKEMGRPKVKVDEDQLDMLCRYNLRLEDVAAFFNCSHKTIERVIRERHDITFVQYREQKLVHTRLRLIDKALAMANNGNVAMLIFSLKNMCQWTDKLQNESVGEKQVFELKYSIPEKDGK